MSSEYEGVIRFLADENDRLRKLISDSAKVVDGGIHFDLGNMVANYYEMKEALEFYSSSSSWRYSWIGGKGRSNVDYSDLYDEFFGTPPDPRIEKVGGRRAMKVLSNLRKV